LPPIVPSYRHAPEEGPLAGLGRNTDAVPFVLKSMPNDTIATPKPRTSAAWVGLFISLFGMLLIRQVFRLISLTPGASLAIAREILMFASAAVLLLVVTGWEKLPLTSIGLGTSVCWKSVLWGLVTAVLCAGAAVVLIKMTGYGHGPASDALDRLPLWLVTLVCFRAGIVEELFYRGYPIERLQSFGLGRLASALIPLFIFGVGHYTGGAANVLIALVLGGILTGFYLWRRDLVSNMIAHTLVDFVGNVLPRLLS
jgi:membrane protease YdiL (CAAX protease family)